MSAGKKRVKKVYPKPVVQEDNLAPWDRCVYCGKRVTAGDPPFAAQAHTRRFPVCSQACKDHAEAYVRADKKWKLGLYLVLLACAVGILIAALSGRQGTLLYLSVLLAGVGFVAFPYPITTFETFQGCSMRRVTQICRVLGVVLAVLAVVFLTLA